MLSSRRRKSSSRHIMTRSTRIYTFISSNQIPRTTRYPHARHGQYSLSSAASSAPVGRALSLTHGRARAVPSHPISSRRGSAGIIHKTPSRTPGRRHDIESGRHRFTELFNLHYLSCRCTSTRLSISIVTFVPGLSCCIRPLDICIDKHFGGAPQSNMWMHHSRTSLVRTALGLTSLVEDTLYSHLLRLLGLTAPPS